MAIMYTQKPGKAASAMLITRMMLSPMEYCFTAENTPSPMPMTE